MEVSLNTEEKFTQEKERNMSGMVAIQEKKNMNVNNMKVDGDKSLVKTIESLTKIFSQKDLLMQSLILFFK
jgi:hypothetical protein